eukprot:1766542-Ditylum_brightwellii.AAC.1
MALEVLLKDPWMLMCAVVTGIDVTQTECISSTDAPGFYFVLDFCLGYIGVIWSMCSCVEKSDRPWVTCHLYAAAVQLEKLYKNLFCTEKRHTHTQDYTPGERNFLRYHDGKARRNNV